MDDMRVERRAFMKGAGIGALAFTVGGVEVLLTPSEARAQGVPFRLLNANEGETIEALGETLVPGARKAGIAHFVDQQISVPAEEALLQARIFNVRPPFANFYRAALGAVDRGSEKVTGRKFAALSTADQRDFVNNMRQNKIEGWTGPSGGVRLHHPAQRCRRCRLRHDGGLRRPRHPLPSPHRADEEVVTWRTKKWTSSSSAPARPARCMQRCWPRPARRSCCWRPGPDWQMSDLISSEMWGRRIRPAGAPFLLEGKNPFGYAGQAGWGVGGAALHYFANHPRFLPNDYKIKSEHNRALDWPISYQDVAPFYDKVADDIGMSGDAKAEEKWRPAGQSYPMPPMKTFRHGEIWVKGFESLGIRMVPAPVAMNSTEFKGRPACIYDGWCHVGLPDRCACQSDGHLSQRGQKGQSRGARALQRHARADQRAGHQGHRRRVL